MMIKKITNLHVPYSLRSHRLCVPKVPVRLQDGLALRSRVNRCDQTTEKKKKNACTHTQNYDFIGRMRKTKVLHVRHVLKYIIHVQTKKGQTKEKKKKRQTRKTSILLAG